ncbi:MAG: hypothetical protein FJX77_16490, partial [Armatimonadetes bacterium]|nr:hypothetical protein [Armatimonadota bacterium]
MSDTLIIGLGGAGIHACRRFVDRLSASEAQSTALDPPDLLLLDTDRSVESIPGGRGLFLTASAALLDTVYRDPARFQAEWMHPEVIRSRKSVEQGTGGRRMLGRLLLLLPENRAALRQKLRPWFREGEVRSGRRTGATEQTRRRVFVLASAAGGTGGGQLVDLGYLIQDLALSMGAEAELRLLLFVPPPAEPRQAANAFATLTELHYFADPLTRYRGCVGEDASILETRVSPYRRIQLLPSVGADGNLIPLPVQQEAAGVYLLLACRGDQGHWAAEQVQREQQTGVVDLDGNPQAFGTFGVEWIEYPEEQLANAVYRNLVRRSLHAWLQGDQP